MVLAHGVDRAADLAYVPGHVRAGRYGAPHISDKIAQPMFTFLLVVQAVIAAALVTVILMQKSEGGGLTSSGSPSGLMSARGASDFLTRATAVLATMFVGMSIALAFIAATRHTTTIDTSLARPAAATAPLATTPADAPGNAAAIAANAIAPAAAPADNGVPLAR